jgi:prepilin-type N-terminal cleavage/methylation domain-containing protein
MTTRRRAGTRRAQGGMTLLEVLAASALLSLFFVAVFGVVWSTIRTRDSIERGALPFATGPVVMQRIVEDLQYVQLEAFEPSKDAFKASADRDDDIRLDFVTAVPSRGRVEVKDEQVRALVNESGYRLRRSETDRDLYALFRREDLAVDGDPAEGGKYYKVCDRVRSFAIDWFDEDPGEPGGEASEGEPEWDAKKDGKLPWGCRVTLVLVGTADERADEDAPPPDYVFQTFVPFRTRYDKPDGAGPKPGR